MKALSILISALLSASAASAVTLTLTPGTLAERAAEIPASDTGIVISGEVNARDLAALAALRPAGATPTVLDLSDATIASTRYTNSDYLGYTYLPASELPPYIFAATSFTGIRLPASLTAVGDGAFSGSALTAAEIPAAVATLGDYAFYDCPNLISVTAGEKLESIGKGAFGNCRALKDADFAACGFKSLPERVFAGCAALESVRLPAGLESVGAEAFAGTGITTLSLSTVRRLEPFALSGMPRLESVTLAKDSQQGEGLLANDTGLTSVSGATGFLPDAYAAGCTALDATLLSSGAQTIGAHALASTAAEELTLGEGLISVDREAFVGMQNLRIINAYALGRNVPYAADNAFDGITPSQIALLVAKDDQEVWKADGQWSRFRITSDPSTIADESISDSGITIRVTESAIGITSVSKLVSVSVYTLDGRLILTAAPGRDSFSMPIPAEKAVIVKADAASSSKIAKLLLP